MGNCHICEEVPSTESHHVYPIHLGGPVDGIQIPLCGNCHSFVHNTANKIFAGGVLDKKLCYWYDKYAKAKPPVKIILEALQNAEMANLDNVLVPISFKIPKGLRDKLHKVKLDAGFTNLNTFMIFLLVKASGGGIPEFESVLSIIKEG